LRFGSAQLAAPWSFYILGAGRMPAPQLEATTAWLVVQASSLQIGAACCAEGTREASLALLKAAEAPALQMSLKYTVCMNQSHWGREIPRQPGRNEDGGQIAIPLPRTTHFLDSNH